jgi:hypothetical protein
MLKRLIPLAAVAVIAALHVGSAQAYDVTPREGATLKNYDPAKSVRAYCPQGYVVMGGGGEIDDDGNDIARLTGLVPVESSPRDFFEAQAQAWFLGQYEPWSLTAYAICARAADVKEHRVFAATQQNPNSATFVSGTAACQGDRVAYGAGGAVSHPFANFNGRVGLQLVRTSNPLDIGRATAREDSSPHGTPNPWWLTTYVVCAKKQGDVHTEGNSAPSGSLTATSYCDTFAHGVHGGGGASGPGVSDAGRSWLKAIVPSNDLNSVATTMVGYEVPSGGVVAHHTCAVDG